jgi:hypothetical protein
MRSKMRGAMPMATMIIGAGICCFIAAACWISAAMMP